MHRFLGPVAVITVIALFLGFGPHASAQSRPPRIVISTPNAGGAAAGDVTVAGSASGPRRITRVWTAVDSGSYVAASGTTSWSSALNTTAYPDGTHILHAKVRDARGLVRTTSITVNFDNTAPSAGSQTMTTPEGTVIDVNTAGPWTTEQIYDLLKANGLDSTIGPVLHVTVDDTDASQTMTAVGSSNGHPTFNATLNLQGVNSTFAATPDAVVGHELGHVRSLYYLTMAHNNDWSTYLQARGIANDPRLNSTYNWTVREIIADDYRLLFGSASAISERNQHLNTDIPDPRDVPGLKDFLANSWASAS